MRKVFSILLVFCLVLCAVGCGSEENAKTDSKKRAKAEITDDYKGEFRSGFARVEIMPEENTPLAGYGNTDKRISNGYLSLLEMSCIAVSDEENNTILLFSVDNIGLSTGEVNQLKNSVMQATGISVDNLEFNCSHSHSAPDTSQTGMGSIALYLQKLADRSAEVAVKALNDRKPCSMFYGETETTGLNFVRHYFKTNGVAIGDNHGVLDDFPIKDHTSVADPTLYVLKFDRKDDKDIIFTSFRAHMTMTGGMNKTDISADWCGEMRQHVERELGDCYCAYFQGGCGNINPTSRLDSDNAFTSDQWRQHGQTVGNYIMEVLKNMTEVKNHKIQTSYYDLTAKIDHSEDYLVPQATIIRQMWASSNDRDAVNREARKYGIASVYHAGGIVTKSQAPATEVFRVYTASIGDVAMGFVPFEQFDTNSCYFMENSPFKYTIAMGYSNGKYSYIPSAFGFDYGCYERDICRYQKGTGEEVADAEINMVNKLFGNLK